MTMFTNVFIAAVPSMAKTIVEAWKKRLVGFFTVGLILVAAFAVLFWVVPRFLPKKVKKSMKYVKTTLCVLALGLLLMLLSLSAGIGFGLGKGVGIGVGDGTGIGAGDGETQEKNKYDHEGELNIAVTGSAVYIDSEQVEVEEVQDRVLKEYKNSLKVVLTDDYSDYGTYMKVMSILDNIFSDGRYEKRKEK